MRLVERLRFVVGRRVIYAFAFMGLCLVVFALLEAVGLSLGFWDYVIAIVLSSIAGWYQARIWVVTVLESTPDSVVIRMTRRGSTVASQSSGDKNSEA
jgi:hypothetical protein